MIELTGAEKAALRACACLPCLDGRGARDCETVAAVARIVTDRMADAWDEGYRLDWTGGVHWDNPYRATKPQEGPVSMTPKDTAWLEGPCNCAECTDMPDTWCCRYCHSMSVGHTLQPATSAATKPTEHEEH